MGIEIVQLVAPPQPVEFLLLVAALVVFQGLSALFR